MAHRPFMNTTPNLYSSDVIKNNRNKEIYTGTKSAVQKSKLPGNSMKYEKSTFDTSGCFRSAPSYEYMLNLTRGFSQCYTPNHAIDNSFNSSLDNIAMNFNTTDLSLINILVDFSANPYESSGNTWMYNSINTNINELQYVNPKIYGTDASINCCPTSFDYTAGIKIDPNGVLYQSIQTIDICAGGIILPPGYNCTNNMWHNKINVQNRNTGEYANIIKRYAQKTDRQFTYPKKFSVLPNGFE